MWGEDGARVGSAGAAGRERGSVRIGEASARVRAADALRSRVCFTGELLDPIYARVAAAQSGGAISPSAARVIVHMIETLPAAVRCERRRV